jgi:hypothetical protein
MDIMQTRQKYFVKGIMNEMRLTDEQAKQIVSSGIELSGPFPEVEEFHYEYQRKGNDIQKVKVVGKQTTVRYEGDNQSHFENDNESFSEERWSERYI